MIKLLIICLAFFTINAFAQNETETVKKNDTDFKCRTSFPVIILGNIGKEGERTTTKHIEFHVKRGLDSKNII